MFWDRVAAPYDLFETIYNGKVYRGTGEAVAKEIEPGDVVLECACGTVAISVYIAPVCAKLIATDYSKGMLRQTAKKAGAFPNMRVKRADMTNLKCRDNRFDKVVAGNVIHLLEDSGAAVTELVRVCKPGGKVIIPTYINMAQGRTGKMARLLGKAGADFKRQFDKESYMAFFRDMGYEDVSYRMVPGRMPCMIAVITKTFGNVVITTD
ncbi:MAG: class I SAM-dependent methyltransferase [Lachnospiraceae bacterium]|nr:class I SAM-dependent methyltransferase [Lachnospiraceae bacterium]